MNNEYIINKVKPFINDRGMLGEDDFNKLFYMLSKKEQYEVINILIRQDIEIDYENVKLDKKKVKTSSENSHKINTLPKLSNEQLCVIHQNGNGAALDALLQKNEKLVWSRVVKYSKRYKHKLEEEDLLQYGNIGLMKAAEKYDRNKETLFSTYSIYWIDQSILRSIADYGFTVRLPVHVFEKVNKLSKLLAMHPNEPKEEILKLAEGEGFNTKQFEELLIIAKDIISPASLNIPVGEDEEMELGELIKDNINQTVEEEVEYNLLKEYIKFDLDTITEKEAKIIKLRFGLDDGKDRTLEEVGRIYDVTRERIRQIEAKALRKLRHPSRSKLLKEFV